MHIDFRVVFPDADDVYVQSGHHTQRRNLRYNSHSSVDLAAAVEQLTETMGPKATLVRKQ